MATIDKRWGRGRGWRYRVRVRTQGQAVSATFATLRAARHWAHVQEAALLAPASLSAAARHTLGELVARYERDVLSRKPAGTARVQGAQLAWWQAQLGPLRLSEVTPAQLTACRDRQAQTRAPATVRGYLAVLAHALRIAVREWQWLEVSPLAPVTPPAPGRGRVRWLAEAERARLLRACQQSSNRALSLVVLLALSTGCRKMELLALRWADVALRQEVLILGGCVASERKTGKLGVNGEMYLWLLDIGRFQETMYSMPRSMKIQ